MSRQDKVNSNKLRIKCTRCESLDDGTLAFLTWMNCKSFIGDDDYKRNPPLILKHVNFPSKNLVKIFDKFLDSDVVVNIVDGVPICKYCLTDDCSHIGFSICLKQLIERECFESNEDLLK